MNEVPGFQGVMKDIHNVRSQIRHRQRGAISPVEYLVHKFKQDPERFYCDVQYENQSLRSLLIAYKEAVEIFKKHNDVIMLDCTYKTNCYDMPLLNVMGITGNNTTIHLVNVFLSGETQADFA